MITIKILNTEDGFDPSGAMNEEQYDEALTRFEGLVRQGIKEEITDAEVEFYRSNSESDAPVGKIAAMSNLTDVMEALEEMESGQEVAEEVLESVWGAGLFWDAAKDGEGGK